ncbi:MAG: DUF423 domain-containing protein [Betaproteobacteria bacterium]|nr:DUF423 domain-containing protein [Betaproteobacteria bacterium]
MNPDTKLFLAASAFAAFLAVAFGAFGAHALRERLPADLLAIYRTAVEYHFWHALGLLAIGLVAEMLPGSVLIKWAGWLMIAGLLLFSGSLYALALSGVRVLGAVTPVGGLCLLAAWATLAAAALRA